MLITLRITGSQIKHQCFEGICCLYLNVGTAASFFYTGGHLRCKIIETGRAHCTLHTFCNMCGLRMEIRKYESDTPSRENEERLAGRIREQEGRKCASSAAADFSRSSREWHTATKPRYVQTE